MDDLHLCLTLHFTKGIGPISGRKLLSQFSDIQDISAAGISDFMAAGLNRKQAESLASGSPEQKIDEALTWSQKKHHHLINYGSRFYPQRLASINNAPLVLYVIGDKDVLHTPQLAMVGSRKPTPLAAKTAREFATFIAAKGITITSGLALGIDSEAHRGCLDAGGLTVAVAATGLDRIYPAKHKSLALEIVESGAMVSEFPLGTSTKPQYFPLRNRIISGLSIGTFVVEAAVRSGSLTTARHATEQNREVMAMPGSIHNPLARGCHQLIRQGAKLVETADDILEELAGQIGSLHFPEQQSAEPQDPTEKTSGLDPQYRRLLECLDYSPLSIDQIIDDSGLQAQDVASMLLILEMEGLIQACGANRYVRC